MPLTKTDGFVLLFKNAEHIRTQFKALMQAIATDGKSRYKSVLRSITLENYFFQL